jgi:hypothetical protein
MSRRSRAIRGARREQRRSASMIAGGMTANDALEMAETMSNGEAAQMAIAAELLGVDYDELIKMLERGE